MDNWKFWLCLWFLLLGIFAVGLGVGMHFTEEDVCDCKAERAEIIRSSRATCSILLNTMAELKREELCR